MNSNDFFFYDFCLYNYHGIVHLLRLKDEICHVIVIWVYFHSFVSIVKYLLILSSSKQINYSWIIKIISIRWFDFICLVYLVLKHKWRNDTYVYFLLVHIISFYEKRLFMPSMTSSWISWNHHEFDIPILDILNNMVSALYTLCDV